MNPSFEKIRSNIARAIVGKNNVVDLILIALVAQGHVLIEDVPGTGKTALVGSLARSVGCSFSRIQFTPDVLPSDITGFSMPDAAGKFQFRPGPLMNQIVLADEINRTSPKTQSALLEAMEEGQITVDGQTYRLPAPFMVLATQNPVEYIGTYPLPEAQMDRFLMRVSMGYPNEREEVDILARYAHENPREQLAPVVSAQEIVALQKAAQAVFVADRVMQYMVAIATRTRNHPALALGVSPRGTLALLRAAQASALLEDRQYVLPDDVQRVALPVLAHRLTLKPEAKYKEMTGEQILLSVLREVKVPVMGDAAR